MYFRWNRLLDGPDYHIMNISTYEVISPLSHEKPPGNQKIVIWLLPNDQREN